MIKKTKAKETEKKKARIKRGQTPLKKATPKKGVRPLLSKTTPKRAETPFVKPSVKEAKPARAAEKIILAPKPEPKPEIRLAPKIEPKSAPKPVSKPAAAPAPAPKPAARPEPRIEIWRAPVKEAKAAEKPHPPKEEPSVARTVTPAEKPKGPEGIPRPLEFETPISLKDLAAKIGVKPNEIIVSLMSKNVFATINQNLGEEAVVDILKSHNVEYRKPPKVEDQIVKEHRELEEKQEAMHLVARPPVVTFMGHVDHGKTSLLDFIRKTRVADKEKGGITQHIGAYEARFKKGSVTFLDTPGHEAFTAMRARGANATDVVVLVVAADDGVMPQTKEALDHARAAGVTIVVAINKCDLPGANIEKVKGQLGALGLTPEDWGGKTIVVPVSAKTGEGVDRLLEMLLLESEMLELKANPHIRARGVVIEGKLSSGQGPVATVLVKNGTLHVGDMVLVGMHYGRIKAMMDHTGKRVSEAGPARPVSILGLSGVPMAGEEFFVVKDEKKARTLSVLKQDEARSRKLRSAKRITLEDFYTQLKEGISKKLAILLKGDVQGSIEAIKKSLAELNTKDVEIDIVHADVGNISESDVMLAVVSNAVVMGFNVKVDEGAAQLAQKEGIEIKIYGIIYEAIEDVRAAMEGLLEPISKEIFVGRALIKQVFKVTKAGNIAGCSVVKGKIVRTGIAKLIRDKKIVYEGKIASLKRHKDDAREVAEGFECGIGLDRHDDIKEGDLIEVYQIEKVARRLDSKK
jgi:translation initiation factor IF-2